MRRSVLVMVLLATATPWNASAATTYLPVGDGGFRTPVSVPTGDTIRFEWVGSRDPHTVTSYEGQSFDSGVRSSGWFEILYDGTPTRYRCEIHSVIDEGGECQGMCGVLVDDHMPPAPPIVTTPSNGEQLATSHVRIEGTTDLDTRLIEVESQDGWRWIDRPAAGTWAVDALLDVGVHTLTVVATDGFWNHSAPTQIQIEVTQLTRPLAPSIRSPADGDTVDGTFAVSVELPPNAWRAEVTVGDETWTSFSWDATAQVVIAAAPGPAIVEVRARDRLGQVSDAATVSVTVDDRAPSVTMTSPSNHGLALRPLVISGTADDETQVARVSVTIVDRARGTIDEQDATCTGCGGTSAMWELTPDLEPGLYEIRAAAFDGAGHRTETRQVALLVI